MLIKAFASAVQGVDARTITVEINTGGNVGIDKPMYSLVGLPDNAVREGMQRIEAAINNSGFRVIRLKTTINLAPAHIRKEGSAYDLNIKFFQHCNKRQAHDDQPDTHRHEKSQQHARASHHFRALTLKCFPRA